ncbi:MAG TPA: hypothetical protein VFI92_12450 [Steroidobacteraceae bacterium]|nr:hypothetical protein [Steroidobacteraceae bacterium]
MDIREHSITLVSVIVGLGLTELLANLNRLIRARRDVRWHALPLIWAAVCLILVVNLWWGIYLGAIGIATPSNAGVFLLYLGVPVLLYLVCSAALPEFRPPGTLDLRAAYFEGSRYFAVLLLAYVVATLLQGYMGAGHAEWTPTVTLLRLGIVVVLLPLAWVRRPWYHWFAATFMLGILALRMLGQTLR